MATSNTPLRFDLPDGDQVDLCTWGYILTQINDFMVSMTNAIELENVALNVIDQKLDEWIPDSNT